MAKKPLIRKLYLRYKQELKRDRIIEIREVKKALVIQGCHPHVSPVVARWFKSKGFEISESSRSKFWFTVWIDK